MIWLKLPLLLSLLFVVAGNLPTYEERLKQYENSDHRHPPPRGATLFVGSSSIERWTSLARDFQGEVVLNRGVSGSQYVDLVKNYRRIIVPYRPRQIVLYSGDNDVASGKTPAQIAASVRTLVNELHLALPDTKIFIVSVKPSIKQRARLGQIRCTNTALGELASGLPFTQFVDVHSEMLTSDSQPRPELFASDGLHMNSKGYAIWTRIIKAALHGTAPLDRGAIDKFVRKTETVAPSCEKNN